MATDFLLLGYQAIKALLQADADVVNPTSGARRFVWFDGDPFPTISNKKPGDFIELVLDWDTQTDDFRTGTKTIGNQQSTGSACPFIESETNEYVLTLTADDVRLSKANGNGLSSCLAAVKKALRAASTIDVGSGATARLGRITIRNEKTSRGPDAAGTARRVVKVRIPVTVVFQGTTQTT